MLGPSVVIAAVGEIVFQLVHDEDALRLRVGYQIIASATVADRALLNLPRWPLSCQTTRFVDVTRN